MGTQKKATSRKAPSFLVDLRKKATLQLDGKRGRAQDFSKLAALNHELEVQKIELILQNEELRSSQADLLESRAHYTELYDFAPVAYFTLNIRRQIIHTNFQGAELLGRDRKLLEGMTLNSFVSFRSRQDFERFIARIEDGPSYEECEVELFVPKTGRVTSFRRWGHLIGTRLQFSHEKPPQYLVAITDITSRKVAEQKLLETQQGLELRVAQRTLELQELNQKLESKIKEADSAADKLRESHKQLSELTRLLIDAQDAERRRVARELHDDLSQNLATLALDTQQLQRLVPSDSMVAAELQKLRASIVHMSQDVHSLAYKLHPAILDHFHLPIALRAFVNEWGDREKLKVRFIEAKLPFNIPNDVASCLYRVMQESLRNIAKYARASPIQVRLAASKGRLELSIRDRGPGIEPTDNGRRRGLGILGMEERVRLVKGTLDIHSRPGHGTIVTARVPITPSLDNNHETAQ